MEEGGGGGGEVWFGLDRLLLLSCESTASYSCNIPVLPVLCRPPGSSCPPPPPHPAEAVCWNSVSEQRREVIASENDYYRRRFVEMCLLIRERARGVWGEGGLMSVISDL